MKQTTLKPAPGTQTEFKWLEQIAHLMDNAFRIPGTNIRFGLDPILGLIPGAGELITFGISGAMLLTMARYGVSRKVLLMMAGNILLDSTLGAIPIIGDVFDFGYKANRRNLELLRKHYQQGKYQGSGSGVLVAVALVVLVLAGLLVFAIWKGIAYLVGLYQQG